MVFLDVAFLSGIPNFWHASNGLGFKSASISSSTDATVASNAVSATHCGILEWIILFFLPY